MSLLLFNVAKAQDTLKINLQQADSIFITNNFYLLASSMNIEAQKAQIIQAKLYPNPIFTADINAYDPDNNKAFHIGHTGQKSFQFEQLILLGGKRKSEIEMAKTNANIAELEFQQLARQLKFRLHSNLFAIGQQQYLLSLYNSQLALLDTLLSAYQIQAEKGNIPLKDVVRLKGAYLKLNNDRAELFKQYYEAQTNLQTLLQTTSIIEFQFSEQEIEKYIKLNSLSEIRTEALQSRPDLLIIRQDKILAEQYLQYQKRLIVPDINLFTSYDQRGGAFNNQVNAGIAIPLPFWNRNQGNIKSSEFRLKEADYNLQAMQNEIMSSLQNNYSFYSQTVSEYQKATSLYNQDFEVTVKGMTDNFQKRNVSMIEFIDFFEAYNEVLTELTRIKIQLVVSGEQLNLLIGKDIY
ncbi:MAG: TolC family protein [Bacteroidetes bacterium HGW-Bacteroidetes-12]|nr:MAG: TolC family protein [Bacteroidetes bacterium HGW-Bacteroidetes-12]